ncbi:MAG: CRISPR-associated endonuclease Cas2 [Desulfobacterales bacterium]|nr:CRISPR-associated endonuclease Cas2 [Desulfobacterales bacterium]
MFYLVCFDIVEDRKRTRVVKIIKQYGHRVQKSVFECSRMTEEQFLKMIRRLENIIDHTRDSVRYYPLCKGCLNKVEFSGIGEVPREILFAVI